MASKLLGRKVKRSKVMIKENNKENFTNCRSLSNVYYNAKVLHKEEIEQLLNLCIKTLSITIPVSYKAFLSNLGYFSKAGFEVYGIVDEDYIDSSIPDVIWFNLSNRKEFNQPNHILCISDIGDGSYYALDLSQMNDQCECPVVVWPVGGYDATPTLEIVAPSFGDWFKEMIEIQLNEQEQE